MIDLITKISPEIKCNSSKIGPIFAFNESFICFIIDSINIELFEYNRKDKKSIKLNGHNEQIKCCKFSKTRNQFESTLLCTCSTDLIILWKINDLTENKTQRGKILGRSLAHEPTQCAFHPNNQILAVYYGENLSLIDVNTATSLADLKFKDYLNNIEFCLFNPDLILITNQSESLLIYNMVEQRFEQSLLNDSTFVTVCSLENEPIIIASSSNSILSIYEYQNNKSLLIKKISLETLYSTYIKNQGEFIEKNESHASFLCIGLQVFNIGSSSRIEFNQTRKNSNIIIVCGTPVCLFFIDYNTGHLIYLVDFKTISFRTNVNDSTFIMPQSVDFSLVENKQINAAFLFLFQNEINIVKCADICVNSNQSAVESKPNDLNNEFEEILTVFPKMSILKDSPLNEDINDKETALKKVPTLQEYLKKTSYIKRPSLTNSKDQPLTFHSKIKSSGYSQSNAAREKFTPLINNSTRSLSLSSIQLQQTNTKTKKTPKPEFKFELPIVLDKKINASDKTSPIVYMKFSADGQNLCLSSADSIVQYLSVNNIEKPGLVFNIHKETIRSIDLSRDCKYLLTASEDKTCKLWSVKKTNDLLIDIRSVKTSDNKILEFKKEIISGNFFYLDKFLLIGTENKFLLCKYFIDSNKNDVQRYLNSSMCKLVTKMELSSAQSITCLSAINAFYSYIVLTGGSDKSIEIFDMNQAKSCLFIPDAHTRNFHQIYQNESEHNQTSYDLFLTNAVSDGIKLWDLRIAQCVNKFDYHLNRCLPIKVSMSPDSNYIVAGAEDRSALVYDLRMSGMIQKYGVFSDTVSNAQFNPKKSQLICSTQDGKLYTYKTK